MKEELSPFAETIFKRSYAITPEETWKQCAKRVATFVAGEREDLVEPFFEIIFSRKFVPGGRYLYSSGRDIPQLTNCMILIPEDSREGWGDLLYKHVVSLSTGGGVGSEYSKIRPKGSPIKRFGGTASGPISLMQMINEVARHVMAGGARRSALWAGLNWKHQDIEDFIKVKDWRMSIKALKENDFNFPAPLDMTNISIGLDDEFFSRVSSSEEVWNLYYRMVKSMLKTGEPGFTVNLGKQSKEIGRNACLRGSMYLLTRKGLRQIKDVTPGDYIWDGSGWTKVIKKFNNGVKEVNRFESTKTFFEGTKDHKISFKGTKKEVDKLDNFDVRVGPYQAVDKISPEDVMVGLTVGETSIEAKELPKTFDREVPKRFIEGSARKKAGFLRGLFSVNGSIYIDDKKVCRIIWLKQPSKKLIEQVQLMLNSLGIESFYLPSKEIVTTSNNSHGLGEGSYYLGITKHMKRFIESIGFIQKYEIKGYKTRNTENDLSLVGINSDDRIANEEVYDLTVDNKDHVFWANGLVVSNCTEVVSGGTDVCNLGSLNLSRLSSIEELKAVTRLAIKFLYLGTFKGWLPHEDFYKARDKNKRIGLGIMGLHEWLLQRDFSYEPNGDLGKWLSAWQAISDNEAKKFSKEMEGTQPVAVRAIAPTGTISILSETSSGVEPVYCTAYKRRFLGNNGKWKYTYVIDPTVERLVREKGVDPNSIEDSIALSKKVEKRIQMQAFINDFVDQGISSTINLPEWGEEGNNNAKRFSEILLNYLPRLRGITVYPDGARSGQPITKVKYETAKSKENVVYEEDEERCKNGVCGL